MTTTERDPLLPPHPRRPTPLPKAKLAAVFAIKLLIPVSSAQVAPYINGMVGSIVKDSGKVGYYTGLIASSFHLAQMLGMYPWARISDRIGRRPVVFSGGVGIAVFSVVFGFSQSIWGIVVSRFLCGLFCGTTGAIHAIVGELTDETNQSIAFPLYDIISALGLIVGPLIGGIFADPVKQHPEWSWVRRFGFEGTFTQYPYILPNVVAFIFAALTCGLAWLILDETLPAHPQHVPDPHNTLPSSEVPSQEADVGSGYTKHGHEPLSVLALLSIPVVRSICISTFLLGFLASAFNVVVVLVAYSRTDDGGLELTPQEIGLALSLMGGLSIFLKLSLTWILRPSSGSSRSLSQRLTSFFAKLMATWPVTFFSFVILGWAASGGREKTGAKVMWIVFSLVLFLSRIGCIPFTLILMLVKENTPTSSSLGTLNGLTELVQTIAIVISPTLIGSLFAFSISHHILGGYLWVLVYVFISVGGAIISANLEKQQRVQVLQSSASQLESADR